MLSIRLSLISVFKKKTNSVYTQWVDSEAWVDADEWVD